MIQFYDLFLVCSHDQEVLFFIPHWDTIGGYVQLHCLQFTSLEKLMCKRQSGIGKKICQKNAMSDGKKLVFLSLQHCLTVEFKENERIDYIVIATVNFFLA